MENATELFDDQNNALMMLLSGENIFLTGAAGSGKSYLVRQFLKKVQRDNFPVLASTGAAAVLVGGRTFHSFFGLGILEGGPQATFEKAQKDSNLKRRIKEIEGIVIDEISMISGEALDVAGRIAQWARNNTHPFGGLQVIAVGDFAQLPPVSKDSRRVWSFEHPIWEQVGFQTAYLKSNRRTDEAEYIQILNDIRIGQVNEQVTDFLNKRCFKHDESATGVRLFPFRKQADEFNFKQIEKIDEQPHVFETIYWGDQKRIDKIKTQFPVPEFLTLKINAEIIFTQNDPQKRWVNGTQGKVIEISKSKVVILKKNGREVTVERVSFDWQNADGDIIASATQFPLNLGYASTIHKSQGATLEKIWCDLGSLWEPGQAYVALSRLNKSNGLNLIRWRSSSIKADPKVMNFYQKLSLME